MTDKLLRRWLVPASLVLVAACSGTGTPVDQGPGAPATMTKTGDAQSAVVANRVPVQPLVVLRDADGRPVPGQTVTFSVAAGDGWVTSSTATSDAGGAATTVWYLGPRAGSPQTLRATASGLVAEFSATATPLLPGSSHMGAHDYVELAVGELPIIVSAPHGGWLVPEEIPDRTGAGIVTIADANTAELAVEVADAFADDAGARPTVVIMRLHRRKLDANREIGEAAQGNARAERAWREFQGFIEAARAAVADAGSTGFFIDLHGHGHEIQRLELGYRLSAADLAQPDAVLNSTSLVQKSTMRAYVAASGTAHAEVIRGDSSLGTLFELRGYPTVPSAAQPHPDGAPYFTGGYNMQRHASQDGNLISGVQIEANRIGVRDTQQNRRRFAEALVAVLRAWQPVLFEATGSE
jgi:hypothetical protein